MKEFEKRKKLKDIEGKFNLGNAAAAVTAPVLSRLSL